MDTPFVMPQLGNEIEEALVETWAKAPGDTVTKRILVRGREPFRVVSVDCQDNCLSDPCRTDNRHQELVDVDLVVLIAADRTDHADVQRFKK